VFTPGIGRGLRSDLRAAAAQAVTGFERSATGGLPFRSALVLTDALAGHCEELLAELTRLTEGRHRFFGGGAGDDGRFSHTQVFYDDTVATDAVVALEIQSLRPLGIGVHHGWMPIGPALKITEASGLRVISINAAPAVEVFQDHAVLTGQQFDPQNPLPFFLHNVVGIETGSGYKLRVPLSVHADGAIAFAAEVPNDAVVRLMAVDNGSTAQAAGKATAMALEQLAGAKPEAALFFDCAATRFRMGKHFDDELQQVQRLLSPAQFAGCNTYGQIARAETQFSGFHNCTAVVCVFPGQE